ncbi:MAG: hypothetical protein AAB257_02955 [Nitrospinota bacterium]
MSVFPKITAVSAASTTEEEETKKSTGESSGGSAIPVPPSPPVASEDISGTTVKEETRGEQGMTTTLPTEGALSSPEGASAGDKSALVGRAMYSAINILSDYSIYWLATVITGTSVGLVVYVVKRKKIPAKNVDLLETWTLKMLSRYATPQQLKSMVALQDYWDEGDLQRVFDRIQAQQSLEEIHSLTPQQTNMVKRFVEVHSRIGQRKNGVINLLAEKGLDKEVITALVRTYY